MDDACTVGQTTNTQYTKADLGKLHLFCFIFAIQIPVDVLDQS